MNWKPGDIAEVRANRETTGDAVDIVNGSVVTLIQFVGQIPAIPGCDYWRVDLDGRHYYVGQRLLYPVDDGDQPGSWEQLKDIWQPKELTVV